MKKSKIVILLIFTIVFVACFFIVNPSQAACNATVTLKLFDPQGGFISDASFAIYEQVDDVLGNPKPLDRKTSGKIEPNLGLAEKTFNVENDPTDDYAIKVWQKNDDVGEFWFYDDLRLECGDIKTVSETLSGIHFVFREPDNSLKKNTEFSVYTQRRDADGNPIKEKEDFVTKLSTSEEGEVVLYVADRTKSLDGEGNDYYIFEANLPNGGTYTKYYTRVISRNIQEVEYVFSDIFMEVDDAAGNVITEKDINLYEQTTNLKGQLILGDKLKTEETDFNGLVRFEYPEGFYAVTLKDDIGQEFQFFNINSQEEKRTNHILTLNNTKISIGKGEIGRADLNIYELDNIEGNTYVKGDKIKSVDIPESKLVELNLAPNPLLFAVSVSGSEFGQALMIDNKQQSINIDINADYLLKPGQRFTLSGSGSGSGSGSSSGSLADRLKGYILLQVEQNGEAWYVDPVSKFRYYLKDGEVAYSALREFGLGITNANLNKIPVGYDSRFVELDTDGDGLSDKMEDGIGTNRELRDSDGDGFDDKTEILGGYDPTRGGGVRLPIDNNLANNLKGRIVLQVEQNGEAWYINPKDGKRYYMKDGDSAYEIMRFLSLGITNADLAKIPENNL